MNKRMKISTIIGLTVVHFGLASSVLASPGVGAVAQPREGISLEFIGQGLVRSPAEVYQYGYFTHVADVENLFTGVPNNASTAVFTFMNALFTTRVTDNGPLRIVDRRGTTTIYLNPAGGASFEAPESFEVGTPVLTATLRHQAILDTANGNTLVVNFDLTVTTAETFSVGATRYRLGRPGQKMTWTASGRPNTSTSEPGQFVFAGMGLSHEPAPPGRSINRSASSGAIPLKPESAAPKTSWVESSQNPKNMLLTTVDHAQIEAVLADEATRFSKFYRAATE